MPDDQRSTYILDVYVSNNFLKVLLADLILLYPVHCCAILIQFGNPALQECTQDTGADREPKVSNEADVQEAGNSLFQCFHAVDKDLFVKHEVKIHFPETDRGNLQYGTKKKYTPYPIRVPDRKDPYVFGSPRSGSFHD